jgi:hypothetical protein
MYWYRCWEKGNFSHRPVQWQEQDTAGSSEGSRSYVQAQVLGKKYVSLGGPIFMEAKQL